MIASVRLPLRMERLVTPPIRNRWARAFDRMSRNGVAVPVTVDHSAKARDVVGRLIELRRVGDVLYGRASGERLMLHACALAFVDPGTGRRVEVFSEAPF